MYIKILTLLLQTRVTDIHHIGLLSLYTMNLFPTNNCLRRSMISLKHIQTQIYSIKCIGHADFHRTMVPTAPGEELPMAAAL